MQNHKLIYKEAASNDVNNIYSSIATWIKVNIRKLINAYIKNVKVKNIHIFLRRYLGSRCLVAIHVHIYIFKLQ